MSASSGTVCGHRHGLCVWSSITGDVSIRDSAIGALPASASNDLVADEPDRTCRLAANHTGHAVSAALTYARCIPGRVLGRGERR
jgi:hypothetical protein